MAGTPSGSLHSAKNRCCSFGQMSARIVFVGVHYPHKAGTGECGRNPNQTLFNSIRPPPSHLPPPPPLKRSTTAGHISFSIALVHSHQDEWLYPMRTQCNKKSVNVLQNHTRQLTEACSSVRLLLYYLCLFLVVLQGLANVFREGLCFGWLSVRNSIQPYSEFNHSNDHGPISLMWPKSKS